MTAEAGSASWSTYILAISLLTCSAVQATTLTRSALLRATCPFAAVSCLVRPLALILQRQSACCCLLLRW